jgi:cellulose synthase/poly-beta-1,6-N-acetylglucosamine synthase-like glycosyltransferase
MIDIELVLRLSFFVCIGLPIVIFASYGTILLYYSKNAPHKKASTAQGTYEPIVSVVIPTHNESVIISKRVENLQALDYPKDKLEMIFVDDSTDDTPSIIQQHANTDNCIHLIRLAERMGYSPSMIKGVATAKGEIIVFGDAGSFLDATAVKKFVRHFQNPKIGVVSGEEIVLNSQEQIGKAETIYQRLFNFLRTAESNMDSTFFVRGEATAVRKSVVQDLQRCFETFDITTGIYVRQKGFQIIFDPEVKFYEYSPLTRKDHIKQKSIRAANLMRVLSRFRSMMFNRKFGKYGRVILPMNFAMIAIAPASLVVAFLLLFPLALYNLVFSATIWVAFAAVVVLALVLSRAFVVTFFNLEFSLLKGLYEVLIRRKSLDKIDKVQSTRRCQ